MLTVRCSALESIRRNPALYIQSLVGDRTTNTGGSFGMFACWQNVAKYRHEQGIPLGKSINSLQDKFIRYNPTSANKKRQEKLIQSLIQYDKEFEKMGFEFYKGNKRIKWDIHNEVRLTGNTPWIVKNAKRYFSFIAIEGNIEWQDQLRFPLLQSYMAENIVLCEPADLSIGVYSLSGSCFDFKCYSSEEIKDSVAETMDLFEAVYGEYLKYS